MTIGNFDGVHRGHRAVMDQLAARRAQFGLPSVVMIFEPQPLEFFRPDRSPPRLTRLREKLSALNLDIVDRVLCVRFDEEFAAITAEEFVDRILVDGLAARFVLVGDDFRFGQGRSGDYESLQARWLQGALTRRERDGAIDRLLDQLCHDVENPR